MNNTVCMKEAADRIGVSAPDVLWALVSIGHPGPFWWEGMRMSRDYLLEWLKRDHTENPIPWIQVELDEAQEAALAKELQVEVAELRFGLTNVRS